MRSPVLAVSCLILSALVASAEAAAPGGNSSPTSPGGPMSGYQTPLSPADLDKTRTYSEAERAKNKAQALVDSRALVGTLQLACEVADAELIGSGKVDIDGQKVAVKAYEVACANHVGYFLESRGQKPPVAISCFAVDAARATDLAQGKKSSSQCELEANKDVKVMATALLGAAGTECVVDGVRWFGLSASKQYEYTEARCGSGKGYLVRFSRSDGSAATVATSCQDAARQGMQCRLTDGGPVSKPVTMQTYRDALTSNGSACEPAQLRVIGRETDTLRHVVELRCAEPPTGRVAFIPLEGNSAKFELIDCAQAAKRDIQCVLGEK
jgi:hypothetical protein